MAKELDLAKLFVRWKPPRELRPWKTEAAMLDAVRAGKKALMTADLTLPWLKSGEPRVLELLQLAFERDLAVVLVSHTTDPTQVFAIQAYVLKLENAWRVPALEALWETAFVDRGWSAAAEAQSSVLLGYTKAQVKRWLAWWKQHQAAWGGLTVYAVLSDAERTAVRDVSGRSFATGTDVTLFYRNHDLIRPDAFRRVPRGMHVARVAVVPGASKELFPGARANAIVTTTNPAAFVNARLKSRIQFLGARGWRH